MTGITLCTLGRIRETAQGGTGSGIDVVFPSSLGRDDEELLVPGPRVHVQNGVIGVIR